MCCPSLGIDYSLVAGLTDLLGIQVTLVLLYCYSIEVLDLVTVLRAVLRCFVGSFLSCAPGAFATDTAEFLHCSSVKVKVMFGHGR